MSSYYKHPLADVQSGQIGDNTRIWQFSVVLKSAVIGANCNLNCHTFVENDVVIGDNVTLKSGVYLWDGIRVSNNVFIGPNATFVNNPYPRSQQYPEKHIGVEIEEGVSIGANATIMGNIKIGAYAMIGAGSMVTNNVPAFQLWFGHPARHKGYVNSKGEVTDINLKSKDGHLYSLSPVGEPILKS